MQSTHNRAVTDWIVQSWDSAGPRQWILRPLAGLYAGYMRLRRHCYASGWIKSEGLAVPVIVVGNLTVGGTGKSPLVRALVAALRRRGYRPGIVARGYGGNSTDWPVLVRPDSDPAEVGDEPVEHALLSDAQGVSVAPSRVAAARRLIETTDCDVIVADDGLQHLAMRRDIDIVVVDGLRGFGNGRCLPAGPLRESQGVLLKVDHVVINAPEQGSLERDRNSDACGQLQQQLERRLGGRAVQCWNSRLRSGTIAAADGSGRSIDVSTLNAQSTVCVSGVGNPQRFEAMLAGLGVRLTARHRFPDHHRFTPQDLQVSAGAQILMTMKDAVKCRAWFGSHPELAKRCWYLNVSARIDSDFVDAIVEKIQRHRVRPV